MTRPRPSSARRRRAFATIAALGLIAVVGVTLAAVATLLAGDVKRTRRAAEDAQLRQLLLAGEAAARATLGATNQPGEVALKLPSELESAGITLMIERLDNADSAENVQFRVTARGGDGRSIAQTLRYTRAAEGWRLQTAEL